MDISLTHLYHAQKIATDVVNPPLFPCYSQSFIESKEGVTYAALQVYSIVHKGISLIGTGLGALISAIDYIATAIFDAIKPAITPMLDAVFSINPVNGKREFVGIPRSWERSFGKILYDVRTGSYVEVRDEDSYGQNMKAQVSRVFHRIEAANQEILNPAKERVKFEYHVKTVYQNQVNAFAIMGGGMVVFDKLVQDIREAIERGEITRTTVEFADGSRAIVDLTGLTEDDVLAGLMGHEMTHVASRHSVKSLFLNLVRTLALFVAKCFLVQSIKNEDKEYQEVKAKPLNQTTSQERYFLQRKKEEYERLDRSLGWLSGKISTLLGLNYSRKNEYEADITGLYMSKAAGFNPLGAIYLQEVLGRSHKVGCFDYFHRNFEWLFTHPHSSHRKRALFAGLQELDSNLLKGKVKWVLSGEDRYDMSEKAPKAVTYAKKHSTSGA